MARVPPRRNLMLDMLVYVIEPCRRRHVLAKVAVIELHWRPTAISPRSASTAAIARNSLGKGDAVSKSLA